MSFSRARSCVGARRAGASRSLGSRTVRRGRGLSPRPAAHAGAAKRRGGSARRAGSTAAQLGEGSARRSRGGACTDAPQRCIGAGRRATIALPAFVVARTRCNAGDGGGSVAEMAHRCIRPHALAAQQRSCSAVDASLRHVLLLRECCVLLSATLPEGSARCRAVVLHLHRGRCSGGCRWRCPARYGGSWHRRCRGRLGLDGSSRRLCLDDACSGRDRLRRRRSRSVDAMRRPARVARRQWSNRRLRLDSSRRLRLDACKRRNKAWRQRALPFDAMRRVAGVTRRRRSSGHHRSCSCRRLGLGDRHYRALAWRLRRRRCCGATLRRRRCNDGRRDGTGGACSTSRLLSRSVSRQSVFLLFTLHRLHLICARAWEIDDATAVIAHCVVVRASCLLSSAKRPQKSAHTPNRESCCKYSSSSCSRIKKDALVFWSRWKWAAAWRQQLASMTQQRHFLLLALHRLHLARARAREINGAAASLSRSIVVRACRLFSSAKASQLGLHSTYREECSKR
jgi:hypothetical protein